MQGGIRVEEGTLEAVTGSESSLKESNSSGKMEGGLGLGGRVIKLTKVTSRL